MSDTISFVPPVMKTFNIIVGPEIHASIVHIPQLRRKVSIEIVIS